MKLQIVAKGGIARITTTKAVDLDQLPVSDRQEFEKAFTPTALAECAARSGTMGADRMSYQITVTQATLPSETFTLQEQQLTPQMLDLIDRL